MLSEIWAARNEAVDEYERIPTVVYVTSDELPELIAEVEPPEDPKGGPVLFGGMFVVVRDEAGPRVGM